MRQRTFIATLGGLFICAKLGGTPASVKQADQSVRSPLARLTAEVGPVEAVFDPQTGVPIYLSGQLSPSKGSPEATAFDFLERYRELLKLESPDEELTPRAPQTDPLGKTHIRFDQKYQGLPVWGKQLVVHLDVDGGIYNLSGRWAATPKVSTTPSLSAAEARQIALTDFTQGIPANLSSEVTLLIYANDPAPALAYQVTLKGFTSAAPVNYIYFIDANSGRILSQYDNLQTDAPALAEGVDLRQITRPLQTLFENSVYKMHDLSRPGSEGIVTKDANNSFDTTRSSVFADGDGFFAGGRDSAGVSAHFYLGLTYDYFLNVHGRNGWDGAGTLTPAYVHVGTNYNNAFWNGAAVNFGDGSGINYKNFSKTFDLVAHEFTHGVTQSTAGLIYQFETGALNESYSDVFAVLADTTGTADTARWLIGEDIVVNPVAPFKYLRNMRSPHKGFPHNKFLFGTQPAYMSEYQTLPLSNDNGGVHSNSGIPNHAFSFLVDSLGFAKTGRIYYRTLAYYLTPGSKFIDAALLTMQAAADLYGFGPEASAVRAAFDSVGVSVGASFPLTVYADRYDNFAVPPGTFRDTSVIFVNNTSLPINVDSLRWRDPHFILPGSHSFTLLPYATEARTLRFSAEDVPPAAPKVLNDTLKVFYSAATAESLNLPLRFYAFDSLAELTFTAGQTGCQKLSFSNAAAFAGGDLSSGLFRSGVGGFLLDGSLALGRIKNGRKLVYRDLLSSQNFRALTSSQADILNGLGTRYQSKFITEDGDLGLTQRVLFPVLPGHCDYVLYQYEIYDLSGNSIPDLLAGIACDFNVPGAAGSTNQAGINPARNLIFVSGLSGSGTPDSNRAAIAFLDSAQAVAFGASAADNQTYTRPTGNWADSSLYDLMNVAGFTGPGNLETDYSALMTFKKSNLIPGDTLRLTFALLTSETGTASLLAAADSARSILSRLNAAFGCAYLLGDLNADFLLTAADIIAELNLIFLGTPPHGQVPASRGDLSCDGLLDALDAVLLINTVFLNNPPASCACYLR